MRRFLIQRVLALLPVSLIVGSVVFALIHLTPGDPASLLAGPDSSPESVAHLRQALGLNQPLLLQYTTWLGRVARGDLGGSLFLNKPVLAALKERMEPTVLLTTASLLVAMVVGIPAGVVAAIRRNTLVDQALMFLATVGVSIPSFLLGLYLMMLVGVRMHLLPVAGYASLTQDGWSALRYLVMPACALGLIEAAAIARMTRASMLEVAHQDFVRTARAKGLHERTVVVRHTLRTALLPIITVLGNSVAVLLGGVIVIETVFNIPGVGRLIIQSVLRRDYPLIQGAVLLIAGIYVLLNLVVDLLYTWVDPRIRYT